MAPPHRWYDGFIDRGWIQVLTPAALRLIFTVGRRVDRASQTRIKLARLMVESGLPQRSFTRAKAELERYGLLSRAKVGGRWTITLANPVPGLSAGHAMHGYKSGHPWPTKRPPVASADGETPTPESEFPLRRQQIQRQLERRSSVGGVQRRQSYASPQAGQSFLQLLGIKGADEELLVTVAREIERRDPLDAVAYDLSRLLQSRGHLIPQVKVRGALESSVQTAAAIFGGVLVEVRDAAE